MQQTTKNQLWRILRMTCLTITGAMKSTPNCSNRDASESDSARSSDHSGGKVDTLQAAYTHATSQLYNSGWDAIHLEKRERPYTGLAVSPSLLQNLQGHYRCGLLEKQRPKFPWGCTSLVYRWLQDWLRDGGWYLWRKTNRSFSFPLGKSASVFLT